MELHELHVLKWQPRTQHHGVAVARAGMRRGAGEIGPAIATGGENRTMGTKAVDAAIIELPSHHAAASAVLHDEVERKELDEEIHIVAQRLSIKRVQNGVSGAVSGRAGAQGLLFAVVQRHATKGTLKEPPVFHAGEGHAKMFQLVDGFRGTA